MFKFIFIAIILIILYITYAGLMKAAGKKTPVIPTITHDTDKDSNN